MSTNTPVTPPAPSITTYSMSDEIKQSQIEMFERNFIRTLNQNESKLIRTPAIYNMGIQGISNLSTINDTELTEITSSGSNPNKVYEEFSTQNRKSTSRRFTKTFTIDQFDRTVNLISDPTSILFQILKDAANRMTDRCIAEAAIAPVFIGGPNEVPSVISAEDDGVITVDATSTGISYKDVISPAITTFSNNYVESNGVTLAISSNEEETLRNDDKYMNAFYSNQNTVDKGKIQNASGFNVITFAGTKNGVTEIESPILKENDGERTNLLLAPKAVAFAFEIGGLECAKSATKVNSYEITIDFWVKAVRRMGKLVQAIKTTV